MSADRILRTVVVDDEIDARDLVAGLLQEESGVEVVGQASNGTSAVETIRRLQPDLVFLDIQMPDFDGFEVIRQLRLKRMPQFIFVTAYDSFAINAFEINALDYLLKPYSRKRFAKALDRAQQAIRKNEVHLLADRLMTLVQNGDLEPTEIKGATGADGYISELSVSTGNRLYTLSLSDVDLIESADHYVKLHSEGRSYMIHESISSLESKLNPKDFTRIHRTKIVSISAVKEIIKDGDRAYFIVLTNGDRHRISRSQLGKLPALVPRTPRD